MRRCFITALCCFGMACAASAQHAGRCEYWIDSDYGRRSVQSVEGEDVSLSFPLAGYAPGLHFFNFRAVDGDGGVGTLLRTLFYLPEEALPDVTVYRYWFDDGSDDFVTVPGGGSVLPLEVDVSGLSAGLHTFNVSAVSSVGEVTSLLRTLFYLPEQAVPDIAGYEWWLDDDADNAVSVDGGGGLLSIEVDVSALPAGKHTFSFRARNSVGHWGPVHVEPFTLSELMDISEIKADGRRFDVYNLAGVAVLRDATVADLRGLPSSVYVVRGRKVIVR